MRVALMGATGLIGLPVLKGLLTRGDTVRVLVRPETLAQAEKIKHLKEQDHVQLVAGGLENAEALSKVIQGVEVVYHLALAYREGKKFDASAIPLNFKGTENLLRACVAAGVRRFVYSSSVAVYGWSQPPQLWPLAEDSPLLGRGSYAKLKISTEGLIRRYHHQHQIECVILRPTSIYGPAIPKFERFVAELLNRPVRYLYQAQPLDATLERGRYSHWVHLQDAAAALIMAGSRDGIKCQTFNIAGNETVARDELVEMAVRAVGQGGRINRSLVQLKMGRRPTPPMYETMKAKVLLGFTPKVTLADGIAEIITSMRAKPTVARSAIPKGLVGPGITDAMNAGEAALDRGLRLP